MIRLLLPSLVAALALAAQDGRGGMREFKECDLARTELRDYCSGCKGWPVSDQVEKGACKKCKVKVEKLETCIKVYWNCPLAHGAKPMRHAKDCRASKSCCKETPSLALVGFECSTCKAKAMKEADLRHAKDTCTGAVKKVCGESTRYPHGGEEDKPGE
jgi:hypothetical protein